MKNIEMEFEGYWGIPATEKVFTEDELIRLAKTQDASLIAHMIATIKKAQEGIVVTAVTVVDENGDEPTVSGADLIYEAAVGATKTLIASHTPAESTLGTTFTNNSTTYLALEVDADDPRIAYVTHIAEGDGTVDVTVGTETVTITIADPS